MNLCESLATVTRHLRSTWVAVVVGVVSMAVAGDVAASCKRWSTTATTPVLANGVATSAISVTYSRDTTYAVTVTLTGSALFSNGLQVYTQNVNKNNPINITATNTVAQSVTVTQTSSTCTQSKTIVFSNAAPTVSTGFSPAAIGVKGTSTKTITLTNPNSVALTGVTFSDTFPSGLKNASPPTTSNSCGGTLTAAGGGSSLVLSGATIPANSSCSVTSLVTASTTGNKTNSTGTVSSSNGLSASAASATLSVVAISTALSTVVASPTTVPADGATSATVTVSLKDGSGAPVSGKKLSLSRTPSTNNTISPSSGTTNSAGVVTFTVIGNTAQTVTYTATDTTDGITLTQTAAVVFTAVQNIAKSFSPSTIAVNGTSTLTVTLRNTTASTLSGQTFTDTYPAGMVNASTAAGTLSGSGCSGTVTGASGGNSLSLSGGSLQAGKVCTASVTVRGQTAGTKNNTVTGTAGSASASLIVLPFNDAASSVVANPTSVVANGSSTSTVTVTLLDGAASPAGVSGRTITLSALTGSSVITTVSGTTNASGVATFTVKNSIAEGPITYLATDATDGITLSDTAQVTFTDMPKPTVSKSFTPSTIADEGQSVLRITLTNPNSSPVNGASFTDNYPADLLNDSPLVITNTCGGDNPQTVAGGGVLDLVGGTIPASGSCFVSVATTTTTTTTGASTTLTNTTGLVPSLNAFDGSSASATLTTIAIDPALSTAVASPTSIEANGTATSTITVTMVDGAGAGVADLAVTLTPSGGSSVVSGPVSTNGNLTDDNGQVTFTVKASTPQTVTYTARNTTNGINVTQQPQVVFTPPQSTVTAITCATACTQTAITSTVQWNVTFNRSVTNVTAAAFSLVANGLTGSSITSVTGSGTNWVVTANVGTGSGTLGLNQTGAGTVSPTLTGTFTGEVYTTPPTVVTAITCSTACTQTTITSTVQWNVTFNRSVANVDASIFSLAATGLTGSSIASVTGSGTSWTVTANVGTGAGTLGLNQTGAGTVSPTLTGTFTGQVYTTPATVVTAITCATACTQTAITTTVQWTVTFNRSVTNVTSAIFTLVPTGLTGSSIASVTGSGTTWTVTANVGTGAGTLGLNQSGAGTVSPTLTGTFTGQVYTTPATVVTAITCATACTQTAITTTVQWNVTFNRSVSNVTAAAFGLVTTGLSGSAITTVSGSGTSWTVTANVGTGAGTIGLNQTGAGTVSPTLTGTFTGQVYTTPTIVTAITCATACTQTAITSTVQWNVTFSRSVTGVDASIFSLAATGLTGSAITAVSGSGTAWTVTANVGTGAGTLGLNQSAAGTVSPALSGTFTGQVYTTPATVVTAITCATACTQTAITTTVQWNVTFNRSVTSVTSAAFSLVATGLSGTSIASVTGSGTSWVVTANVGTGAGNLGLNQTGAGTVSPTLSGTFTGQVYTTPPTKVTAIACASTCTQALSVSTVSWTVTFNRSVTGVAANVFSLAASGLSGAFITSVSGSGTSWTVTANLGVGSGTLGLNQSAAGSVSPALSGTFTGQVYTLLTAPSLAIYRFDETRWTGTAAQVTDSSGNGYHAQALNGATTANTAPAPVIGTDPGTCRYGVMTGNGISKGYVKTPLPRLSNTDFTVGAWMRSTNTGLAGQRIVADDQGTDGWAFSFSDTSTAKLRFYSRLASPVSLDSTYTLSANTWYFVAAVMDYANRTRTIYVFDATGNLLANTSDTFIGFVLSTSTQGINIGMTASALYYFSGFLDEVQIYPRVLSQAAIASLATQTHPCPVITGPDHFQISHGGTGVTCAATAVTLSAHYADHSVFNGYTGTVSLTTSVGRGDWSLVTGGGTLANGTANDGAATYTFAAADNGSVTLGFQDTTAETLSLNAADSGVTETGGSASAATDDPSITFATTGFEFRADGVANTIGTQIAGKSSATAPGAQTLQIRAIRSNDASTACVTALQGARTVQFAYECISPAACSGSTLSVNGGSSTAIAGNPSGSVGSYTDTAVSFDGSGLASFSLNWSDAGSARLHARYPLPLPGGAASGNFMAGSSNTFVSRPFAYHLSVTGNPGATTAAGSKFLAAGTPFNGSARAVAWSAADDTNNDGIADGMESGDVNAANNANLSDNAVTPNFAPSSSLTLGSTLILPSAGTHPGITGSPVATFTNGVAAITGMRYDETGIIEITAAQGGSYLGLSTTETAKIRGSSGYVGRFHPKRFTAASNSPVLGNACSAGAFTWLGQPFRYSVAPVLSLTALNAQGSTTGNYTTSGFFKLGSTLSGRSYANTASGAHPLTVLNAAGATVAGDTGGTGIATLSLASGNSGDTFTYTRSLPEAPFAAQITASFTTSDLTDTDGICLDTGNDGVCDTFSITAIAGANLRYGRLVADNATGSELVALRVPVYTQYYSSGGFLLNSADVCTSVPSSALDFGVGTPSSAPAAGVLSFPVDTGTSTATFAGAAVAGQLGLGLSAPGAGKTGEITLQINLGAAGLPWLQYDWNGDGTPAEDPTARATFGTFQGPKRVIFKREVW